MAPITSDLDKVRLELGDTDTENALLTDDEINYFLAEHPDILAATAAACEALARRFARAYDFEEDGQKFSRSQMSKAYAQLGKELRQRSSEGFTTLPTTRTDGYSDSIDYRQSDHTSGIGRVLAGYYEPDLPR